MSKTARAGLEALGLLVVSLGLGLAVNAGRPRKSIDLSRDYQPAPPVPTQPAPAPLSTSSAPAAASTTSAPVSPFAELNLEQVAALLEQRDQGFPYVFLDARKDELFEAGHIPGAVQCDFYYIGNYINTVLAAIDGAERIIVYCNGGDCEDSLLVCGELTTKYGVPGENIYLYRGGFAEWKEHNMPVAAGRE